MFELDGKVALVTGAGRGVGRGIARVLASQGSAVLVNDLDPRLADEVAGAVEAAGGTARACPGDVTDPGAMAEAVSGATAGLGPVDIFVNNAGIPRAGMDRVSFLDTTTESWRGLVELNLFGFVNGARLLVPSMVERGWGRVVLITSEAGRIGLDLGVSPYAAAKAGAVGLLRHLALETGPRGVTVNAVSLGLIDNVAGPWAEAVARGLPTRRLGTPDDVGAAVAFLASEEAGWITGQVLPVNGGAAT
jgi:NAD(P)-dependent dehydrogenase (short-subunit alcohol dehydrogenase family)